MDLTDFRQKKVLVVDDFANVRKSIKAMLQDLGIPSVHEAGEGNSATKMIQESQYDLILCDYNLGKGRDGTRLLEEWRKRKLIGHETIFVLITAETSRDVVVSAVEFKPDDYLAKPFTMEVLSTRISRWFERRFALAPLLASVEKKQWHAVVESASSIIENYPRFRSVAQKHLIEGLMEQDQLDEAENYLQGLLERRSQSWAQAELCRIDIVKKDFVKAEKGLKAVLIADPNLLVAYDYLATALEAQNKNEELQRCLEDAVARAPQNIQRQRFLVDISVENTDYHRSNIAMKEIVTMASDTMHQSLVDYQHYVKGLQNEASNTEEEPRLREIKKEIVSANKKMTERYHDNPNSRLFSKALLIQRDSNPTSNSHTKTLNGLFKSTFDLIDEITIETGLFIIETFYLVERFDDGDEMVRRFKLKCKNDPESIKRLNEMQAEPVSLENRVQAKELNSKGIELYKEKQYAESIQFFDRAMSLSPRHPGVILNLVQSHLLQMKKIGINQLNIDLCVKYIKRLNYLPEDHYQFDRYKKLEISLKSMK